MNCRKTFIFYIKHLFAIIFYIKQLFILKINYIMYVISDKNRINVHYITHCVKKIS